MSDFKKIQELGSEINKLSVDIQQIDIMLGKVAIEAHFTGNGNTKPCFVLRGDTGLLKEVLEKHRVNLVREFKELQTELSKL